MSTTSQSMTPAERSLKERYESAMTLEQFVARAIVNGRLWADNTARALVPLEYVAWGRQLQCKRSLLVLLEDWCGDAVSTIPVLAALAAAVPNLELRVIRRDQNLDLMDAHLTNDARAIPVVLVLDHNYTERAWWGPRPAALQRWTDSAEARALGSYERFREQRRWYARDRGHTTLTEVLTVIERTTDALPRVA
jgi:hypothetical protein